MKNQIKNIKELKVGTQLNMISKKFNGAENKITIVSEDCTGLKRDIVYAVFTDRIEKIPTQKEIKSYFQEKKTLSEDRQREIFGCIFAIWGYDIGSTIELHKL